MSQHPLRRLLEWLVPKLRTPLLTGVLLVNLALQVGYLLPRALSDYYPMADADVYAMAGRNVLARQPLYPLTPQGDPRTPDGGHLPFLYPPPFAALLAPVGALPQPAAVRLLKVLTFLSLWAYAAALCKLATSGVTWRGTLGAGAILTVTPGMHFNLISGQVEPFLWLMLALSLLTPATGVWLAASCLVKPFAAWPLALAALRAPRRVLPQAALTATLGLAFGALLCGFGAYAAWLHYTPERMYRVIFFGENISLGLLPLRVLGWQTLPSWGRAFLMGMYVLGPGAAAWLTRRRPLPLQIAWVAAAAILFAPFSRLYYLPMLLVPLALEVREALAEHSPNNRGLGAPPPAG